MYQARIRHEMIDFRTWRVATVRAVHAEPLYRVEDGHYQFKYFPAFAVVMAPFGLLDEHTGQVLWFSLSIALLVTLLRWSVSGLPERRLLQGLLLSLTVVLMAKFYARELLLGQTNLLLGVLLLASVVAINASRPVAAGVLAGAAVFVKPYALVLLPWLALLKWQAGVAFAGVVTAGLLLPVALYGWSGNVALLRGWLQTVTASTPPNLLTNDNISIAAMWAKWLGLGTPASLLAVLTTGGLVWLMVDVWRHRRNIRAPIYLEGALLMLLIPLVSPQGWDYVLLLATPAVVCLVDRWRELTAGWKWVLAIALAVMGLTMFDLMGRQLYGQFMQLSVVSVCALIVAVGLAHVRRRGLA
jgi:hypothetical protein